MAVFASGDGATDLIRLKEMQREDESDRRSNSEKVVRGRPDTHFPPHHMMDISSLPSLTPPVCLLSPTQSAWIPLSRPEIGYLRALNGGHLFGFSLTQWRSSKSLVKWQTMRVATTGWVSVPHYPFCLFTGTGFMDLLLSSAPVVLRLIIKRVRERVADDGRRGQ